MNAAPSCVVPFRNFHAVYICDRLRADEIEQYVALTGAREWNPEVAARGYMLVPGPKFTVVDSNGLPAAAGGFEQVIPGIWQSWMCGTQAGWDEKWRSITKACVWLMNGLLKGQARRLETLVLASRKQTCDWYERALGMHCEGEKRNFCADGSSALMYAKVRNG
jgi:hypothetical protein